MIFSPLHRTSHCICTLQNSAHGEKGVHHWRYLALLTEYHGMAERDQSASGQAESNVMVWGMDGDFWLAWGSILRIKGAMGECIDADLLR